MMSAGPDVVTSQQSLSDGKHAGHQKVHLAQEGVRQERTEGEADTHPVPGDPGAPHGEVRP